MIFSCLAAFFFGAAVDFLYIRMLSAIERVAVWPATGWSMAMGAAGLMGVTEALDSWWTRGALVLGYGAGTLATMLHKRAQLRKQMAATYQLNEG